MEFTKENKVGTAIVSRYEYGVNAIGQRTSLAASGSAFAASRDVGWFYNARGEVIGADSSVPAHSRIYDYDSIGNRKSSMNGIPPVASTFYTANALNQYTAIGSSAPAYDPDGNRTSGQFTGSAGLQTGDFEWDAENRLVRVESGGSETGSYRYDPFGRRIMKTAAGTTTLFLYDGWNPAGEYHLNTGNWKLKTSFLFGQDLSGSLQGAGGVGGLLSATATVSHRRNASTRPTTATAT